MSGVTRPGLVLGGLLLVGAGFLAGLYRGGGAKDEAAAKQKAVYHCPMHPYYVSDKPGECPICHMKLVPGGSPSGSRKVLYYRSPMDPRVTSPIPAKDSMGMDFVPVYEDVLDTTTAVAGRAAITLSPERRQMLGVRSEHVRRTSLDHVIRTLGRVAVDERRLHHVHTKFDGYVEHLYVDFTGKFVEKGQPLLSIYSPDLVATQQEYLLAYRARSQLAQAVNPSVARGGVELLDAARQRLLFWDIRPADIQRLETTGEVMRTLDLYSDLSGYVVQKTAFHGMRLTPSDTLFDIADLSRLWVLADVYEYDLSSVRLGMPAEVTVPYLPGKAWRGPVTYVDPTVDSKTRTIKVRVEVENAGQELKPDMFADVFLKSSLGAGLVVPESAVISSGDRRIVFLDRGDGRYEPREVTLGIKAGADFQVLSGLEAGDRVVVSANFLIDSESSLKAALATMSAPRHEH